jgi:tRNA A-37 threonylcarbamoyl transferase component Bud32
MSITPFVVGQWVSGEKFYGRTALIDEILTGPRNWLWLLGTRRIGKTSLLRQVERLVVSADSGWFPLFWDFQAAASTGELHASFAEYLEDVEDRLVQRGIELDEVVVEDDLFASIKRLRRRLHDAGSRLLLLCDEVEKLIGLHQQDPGLLAKLRDVFQRYEDVRTVMAATRRLWALAEQTGDTSPFLHGLSPLYIQALSSRATEALIRQDNLPPERRPRIDADAVAAIRLRSDNHPFLTQLLAKRYLETGDLEDATEQVAADPMVGFFFSVDHEMLSDVERGILRVIVEHDSSTSNTIQACLALDSPGLNSALQELESLGYVRRDEQRRFVLVGSFFRRWLGSQPLPKPQQSTTVKPRRDVRAAGDDAPGDVPLGEFDGRYELVERMGQGATGIVYKAYDKLLRANAAIKLLRPQYVRNEEVLERLRREIILARDISHPNVVAVYHLGQFERWKYLTMKWIGGPTLAREISRHKVLPIGRLARIAEKLAGALGAAHACRVLHRDLKPQNVLLDEAGTPHLTDFGLARLIDEPGMTLAGVFLGTPNYASPEQAAAGRVDERSDLYSLGVIMYEMATGQLPFQASSASEVLAMHCNVPAGDPRELRADLPDGLAALISSCLEKDPARRPQSAGELSRAVALWSA